MTYDANRHEYSTNLHAPGPIRISILQNIFETAQDIGVNLRAEFAARGLTPESIQEDDTFITLNDLAEFLSIAIQKTKQKNFHFLLASSQNVPSSSSSALLARTAPTLRDAFTDAEKFGHNFAQPVHVRLDESAYSAKLLISIENPGLTPDKYRICTEFILATYVQFVGVILGAPPQLNRVSFPFMRGEDMGLVSRYFRSEIEYESEMFGLEFPMQALNKPLVYANSELHNSILKYLSAPSEQPEAQFDQGVRAVIHSLLSNQTLSIERVARSFGCSKRTLQRWIKQDLGVSYKTLVEEVRFDVARHLLEHTHMPITEISLAAGYSKPTNFTRGFKKAVGCSPRHWRKIHNSQEKYRPFLASV